MIEWMKFFATWNVHLYCTSKSKLCEKKTNSWTIHWQHYYTIQVTGGIWNISVQDNHEF